MRCLLISNHNKFGQVWVETVIYTLVGLAILGTLIAVSKPKIEEMRDESLIEQAMESMLSINSKIYEASKTKGMRTRFDLKIGKGFFIINSKENKIYWQIDSSVLYSEEDVEIEIGLIKVLTKKADPWMVELQIPYNFDIRFEGEDIEKSFSQSSIPYKFFIENEGAGTNSKIILNFGEI